MLITVLVAVILLLIAYGVLITALCVKTLIDFDPAFEKYHEFKREKESKKIFKIMRAVNDPKMDKLILAILILVLMIGIFLLFSNVFLK